MCLAALALNCNDRFPLVLAANRDEFHARETQAMDWWQPGDGRPWILSGRDRVGGGTWFGISPEGRWALLTNIRSPRPPDLGAPSRGEIVAAWLSQGHAVDKFWMHTGLKGYNGYNVIAGRCEGPDASVGWDAHWFSAEHTMPRRLLSGAVHGLSNGSLDEPWPKVRRLKQSLTQAMSAKPSSAEALAERLFEALQHRAVPPDAALPSTGVPLAAERALGAIFVAMPERGYGTRSSHVLVVERQADGCALHLFEQSYTPAGEAAERRQAYLPGWPRPTAPAAANSADTGPDRRWAVVGTVMSGARPIKGPGAPG